MDLAAALAQQGIIHGDDQGGRRIQELFDPGTQLVEELVLIETLAGIEAVIGAPILLGPVLVAEQAGDGVAAKGNQMREQMAPPPGEGFR
jgi:hypothetical protein